MRPPAGFIYLLGRAATPGAAETRQFLSRNGVGFRWVDVDDDPLARLLSADRALSDVRFPCALFDDGSMLERPAQFMRTRFVPLVDRIESHERITVRNHAEVVEARGEERLGSVALIHQYLTALA